MGLWLCVLVWLVWYRFSDLLVFGFQLVLEFVVLLVFVLWCYLVWFAILFWAVCGIGFGW